MQSPEAVTTHSLGATGRASPGASSSHLDSIKNKTTGPKLELLMLSSTSPNKAYLSYSFGSPRNGSLNHESGNLPDKPLSSPKRN